MRGGSGGGGRYLRWWKVRVFEQMIYENTLIIWDTPGY